MNKNVRKAACVAAFALAAAGTFALEGTVTAVTGKVEQQKGSTWVAVNKGDVIQKGAVISTGFNSEATLSIDGTSVTIGALTRITVEQLAQNASGDNTQLFLDSGTVSADVRHSENKRSDFKVRSPVATASVRGTQIELHANGDFFVSEGLADYGPAESTTPQVQGDAAAQPASGQADGQSTVFTSAQEVGGSWGTPVYAGWSSSTDSVTGDRESPQARLARTATTFGDSTASMASREAEHVSTTVRGAYGALPGQDDAEVLVTPATGSVVITVTIDTDD